MDACCAAIDPRTARMGPSGAAMPICFATKGTRFSAKGTRFPAMGTHREDWDFPLLACNLYGAPGAMLPLRITHESPPWKTQVLVPPSSVAVQSNWPFWP